MQQVKKLETRFMRNLPGGPVVKNPSCNAGDAGLIPGWGTKILYASEPLSPHVLTRELLHG